MAIEVTKRPYDINWSGNPIEYQLYSAAAASDAAIYFEIKVLFKYPGGAYSEIITLPYFPYQGYATANIKSIIDGLLEYALPPLTGAETDTHTAGKQTGYFYIHFREINGASAVWDQTEIEFTRLAVKGGIAWQKWRGSNYFTSYFNTEKPFFTWQVNGRQAAINERMYLAFFNTTTIANPNLKAKIFVTYTDATTRTFWITVATVTKDTVVFIPAGATQLDLPALEPDKDIYHWQITMQDHTSGGSPTDISETFKYYADNRMQYNDVVLNYRNSIGGIDSVLIRGVIIQELQYQGDRQILHTSGDYFKDKKTLPQQAIKNSRETIIYKGDAGFIPKEEQQRLRDTHVTRELWWEALGQWLPILNVTGNFRLASSDDQLWNMPIEWTVAKEADNYYTPDAADIGNPDYSTNVCPIGINDLNYAVIELGATKSISFFPDFTAPVVNFIYQLSPYNPAPVTELYSNLPVTLVVDASIDYELMCRALCADGTLGAPSRVTIPSTI